MSGTSLDGLDMALCEFEEVAGNYSFSILKATTLEYDQKMKSFLRDALNASALELLEAHQKYGLWVGKKILQFLHSEGLNCDLISSHGHTIHHRPELGFTFQLGAGTAIANHTQIGVVCDFRTTDVSLGGQGAPLVPIGDLLLFPEHTYCLNLGGICNISEKTSSGIIAYDIGMANMLLNYLAQKAGLDFDEGGRLAASGQLDTSLFKALNELEYHQLAPPKSLGIEYFTSSVQPVLELLDIPLKDALHTAVHHIAYQIKAAVKGNHKLDKRMLITGGGAKNDFLIQCISEYCQEFVLIEVPATRLVDFKEAMIFAFMGYLQQHRHTNCLKSVTGASRDSVGGFFFKPGGA